MTTYTEEPQPTQERGPISVAATKWIHDNHDAMLLIEKFAITASHRCKRIGMQLIIERVRWEIDVATHGSKFKINNNFAAYIARWLISRNPSLHGVIMLRELRAA